MSRVLFVCMPFAATNWPSLALGTLKAICERAGIAADVRYLNMPFAAALGASRYDTLRERIDAELCFTCELFPELDARTVWERYLAVSATGPARGAAPGLWDAFSEIAERHAPELIRRALDEIPWDAYDVVGFTTGYYQLTANLALARALRRRHPEKIIMLGGASCEDEMGPALLRGFDTIDVVVSGEADEVIVPLIGALRAREPIDLPGVHVNPSQRVRAHAAVRSARPMVALDALPVPDYDDYFAELARCSPSAPIRIPFESSRGCWWGQKHPCSFCGLNGTTMGFRTKSAAAVLHELRTQYERYGLGDFIGADNILDMAYFKTLLPELETLHREHGFRFFYETKSNLREDHVRALRRAGILEIQPGIESFSDHVLALMDKGTTGLNQVRFLRDCATHGIDAHYGVLWGSPGETAEDNRRIAALVPYLRHLPPPTYIAPVVLERFSQYFMRPADYGIRDVKPARIYEVVLGNRPLDYAKIAYNFIYDHDSAGDEELGAARDELIAATTAWKEQYRPNTLVSVELDDSVYVADTRTAEPALYRLDGAQRDVLALCATPRKDVELHAALPQHDPAEIDRVLAGFVAQRIMLRWEDRGQPYLSLPVPVAPSTFFDVMPRTVRHAEPAEAVG